MMPQFELLTDEGWRPADKADPAADPDVIRVQRELEQEAAQAKMRARMQAVDEANEVETENRTHLADRLRESDDEFTRAMLAAAREDNE
jgi:hypothetical protein